jgi:NAD(P)-dependent dehydrogenase (short-subunit alcohol dehydrogenase family)
VYSQVKSSFLYNMSSFVSWKGLVVCITGANRGIGYAIAKNLSAQGALIYATCRRSNEQLNALNLNGGAVIEGIDMMDDDCGNKLAARISSEHHLDVLLNNAGILEPDNFETINSPDSLKRAKDMYEVNALGPVKVTTALSPRLKEGGKMFMMSSLMGSLSDNGSGNMYGYRMSKAAMNMAGKNLAIHLKDRSIAVQVIHPGFVKTDMTARFGGGGKDVDAQAAQLIDVMARADLANTGKFIRYDGTEDPW